MVATSFWYVSVVPPERAATASAIIASYAGSLREDPRVLRGIEDWTHAPETVLGPDLGGHVSGHSEAFLESFRATELPEQDLLERAIPETENSMWDLADEDRPHDCRSVFAAIRGVPVVSLLYLALGPLRVSWLPGYAGVFAVGADSVDEAAGGVRKAHALSPADRAEAIRRMHSWLGVGEDHGYPVHHLLEALPVVFGKAAIERAGVIGLAGATSA